MLHLLVVMLGIFCYISNSDDSQQNEEESEYVVTIDADNFEEIIASNNKVLIEFFAPWCSYCKQFAPEYESAAYMIYNDISIKDEIDDVLLCKIDATDDKNALIAEQYNIEAFPTLKYFINNNLLNPIDFDISIHGSSAEDLINWIVQRNYPSTTTLTSIDDITSFLDYHLIQLKQERNVVLIVYIDENKKEILEIIEYISEIYRDIISIGIVNDETVINNNIDIEFNNIYLYSTMNKMYNDINDINDIDIIEYNGDLTDFDSIDHFIRIERVPFIGEITEENHEIYEHLNVPILWIAMEYKDNDIDIKLNKMMDIMIPFAKQYRDKLVFVWFNKDEHLELIQYFGFKNNTGFIIETLDQKKYIFNHNLLTLNEPSKLEIFFNDFMNDKIEQYIRSEPIPNELYENYVYILVGSSMNKLINDENHQEILIYFYSEQYCVICQQFNNQYNEIAEAFKNVNDLKIAKINIDNNDIFEIIESLPALILYPKGLKINEGINYDVLDEEYLKTELILKWIKQNVNSDLSEYDDDFKFTEIDYGDNEYDDNEYDDNDHDDDHDDENVIDNEIQTQYQKGMRYNLILISIAMGIGAFIFGFGIMYKKTKNKAE